MSSYGVIGSPSAMNMSPDGASCICIGVVPGVRLLIVGLFRFRPTLSAGRAPNSDWTYVQKLVLVALLVLIEL